MNGVHDLGGMHGFGPVDTDEPVPARQAQWEYEVIAIQRATVGRAMNIDEFRHGIERMAPAHYLGSSYFEHWLDGVTRVLIEKGLIAAEELDERTKFFEERPDASPEAAAAGPLPEPAPRVGGIGVIRESTAAPRFKPGDRVRTRLMQPVGHTRLPRYARNRVGVVENLHGVHVFPDSNAHGSGEQPQPLYSIRFEARELWGDSAEPNQVLYLDLWESYLLPA